MADVDIMWNRRKRIWKRKWIQSAKAPLPERTASARFAAEKIQLSGIWIVLVLKASRCMENRSNASVRRMDGNRQ
jgi:hypothetical protein